MDQFPQPHFERQVVDAHRQDGYWIEAFDIDRDGKPDLVGYGLNMGEVNWYQNPDWDKTRNSNWHKTEIAKFLGPVGMHHVDVDGDGWHDIVICYQYGQTMINCDPKGGKIVWLQNPGESDREDWVGRYIGRATSMHRLKVGYFTQDQKLQVLALPIVGKPDALHSPTPILLFTQPDDVYGASQWECTVIKTLEGTTFHVIHGVSIKKYKSQTGLNLDSALIASEEGITWLYFDPDSQMWSSKPIGKGELNQVSMTGFKGSGDVDAGRVGDDPFAYIATIEPFHGNTVSVYYKSNGCCEQTHSTLSDFVWERVVLDVNGSPNSLGEGPGHFVVCADFDNDGDDEFLVALRGPMPWQGVFYYKAIDVKNGVFAKCRVSSDSAARIAVADFDGDGRLDFATIGYSVAGYYTTENPQILVFYNRFAPIAN
jgi:hypothetical protein